MLGCQTISLDCQIILLGFQVINQQGCFQIINMLGCQTILLDCQIILLDFQVINQQGCFQIIYMLGGQMILLNCQTILLIFKSSISKVAYKSLIFQVAKHSLSLHLLLLNSSTLVQLKIKCFNPSGKEASKKQIKVTTIVVASKRDVKREAHYVQSKTKLVGR